MRLPKLDIIANTATATVGMLKLAFNSNSKIQ